MMVFPSLHHRFSTAARFHVTDMVVDNAFINYCACQVTPDTAAAIFLHSEGLPRLPRSHIIGGRYDCQKP